MRMIDMMNEGKMVIAIATFCILVMLFAVFFNSMHEQNKKLLSALPRAEQAYKLRLLNSIHFIGLALGFILIYVFIGLSFQISALFGLLKQAA